MCHYCTKEKSYKMLENENSINRGNPGFAGQKSIEFTFYRFKYFFAHNFLNQT